MKNLVMRLLTKTILCLSVIFMVLLPISCVEINSNTNTTKNIVESYDTICDYFDSGAIRTITIFNSKGMMDLEFKTWYENGQIETFIEYENGRKNGVSQHWYSNGQIWSETVYLSGYLDKYSKSYDSIGNLTSHWVIEDHLLIDVPVGEWPCWPPPCTMGGL